ncbi:MAG: hypothetical protein ACYC5K_13205 [Saccharofermentanales bacterium]
MNQYIYPQNLKAQAKLWLWNLKDLSVIGIAMLVSVLSFAQIRFVLPLAVTCAYAFLTIRFDEASVLDFLRRAFRFFIRTQQYYEWRGREK